MLLVLFLEYTKNAASIIKKIDSEHISYVIALPKNLVEQFESDSVLPDLVIDEYQEVTKSIAAAANKAVFYENDHEQKIKSVMVLNGCKLLEKKILESKDLKKISKLLRSKELLSVYGKYDFKFSFLCDFYTFAILAPSYKYKVQVAQTVKTQEKEILRFKAFSTRIGLSLIRWEHYE